MFFRDCGGVFSHVIKIYRGKGQRSRCFRRSCTVLPIRYCVAFPSEINFIIHPTFNLNPSWSTLQVLTLNICSSSMPGWYHACELHSHSHCLWCIPGLQSGIWQSPKVGTLFHSLQLRMRLLANFWISDGCLMTHAYFSIFLVKLLGRLS